MYHKDRLVDTVFIIEIIASKVMVWFPRSMCVCACVCVRECVYGYGRVI